MRCHKKSDITIWGARQVQGQGPHHDERDRCICHLKQRPEKAGQGAPGKRMEPRCHQSHCEPGHRSRLCYRVTPSDISSPAGSDVVNALNEVDSAAVTVVEMASALSTTRRVVDPAEHRETTRVSNLLLSWRRPPTRPTVDTVSITDKGRAVAERKPLLIRVDPAVHDALARWAADELRSTTAQIELVLRRALADVGRLPSNVKAMPRRGRPRKQEPLEPSVSPVPTLAAASFGEPGPSSPQRRANARASVVSPS